MDETMLQTFMCVLVAFIVVLVILGIILIVFLRVILSALSQISTVPSEETKTAEDPNETLVGSTPESELAENTDPVEVAATQDEEAPEQVDQKNIVPIVTSETSDKDQSSVIIENNERVRYDRSCAAKLCQLKKETKEWYSELKNELLSYEKVKARSSWRYETYRIAKTPVARFTVRGKTLCLLLAVDPTAYIDTKYKVENFSDNAAMADTPTLYRIKSARRIGYAKELIADVMKISEVSVNPRYVAKDYFMPYEGDVALMQRGLVKRIVKNTSRKFRIEEINGEEIAGNKAAETRDENKKL